MNTWDCVKIENSVVTMLQVNMGLQEGERVLFVTDIPRQEEWSHGYPEISDFVLRTLMVRGMYDLAVKHFPKNSIDFYTYYSTGAHGVEPPQEVTEKLKQYDVVLLINTYSLTHTQARLAVCRQGGRVASCPNLDLYMMEEGGVMGADYPAIAAKCKKIAALLTQADTARIWTPDGTDVSFSIRGREGLCDDGFYTTPGSWGNLPGGEAYTSPVEGTAEGTVVVPAGWVAGLKENMTFHISKGEVAEILGGGEVGDFYRSWILGSDSPRHRRNFAELGIGTNERAKNPASVLEAEKIDGTVHIATGDNSHMGGMVESDFHDDFVLREPDLYLDGKRVMEKGVLQDV